MSIKAVVGQTVTDGNKYKGGETNTIIISIDERTKTIFGDIKERFINTLQPKIVHVNIAVTPEHTIPQEQIKTLTDDDANNVIFNGRIYYLFSKSNDILIYNNYGEDEIFRFLAVNTTQAKYHYSQYKIWNSEDIQREVDRLDGRIDEEILRATTAEEAIYTLIGKFEDHTDNTVLGYFNNNAIGTIEFSHNPATGKMHYLWKDILGEVDYENDLQLNTNEIIIAADLDYENKKIIYTLAGTEETESGEEIHKTIECDISRMIDDYNEKIAAEQDRAEQAEATLQDNINAEETRATEAEQLIQDNLDAETSRAMVAEDLLDDKITSETTRAESEETRIENKLDARIDDEIQDRIDDVNAEEARATQAEETLQENLDSETERATEAEAVLNDKIDDEISRAEQAEQDLNADLNQEILDRVADVDAEELRATSAEELLQQNLDSETERAIIAENILDDKIETETTRATTKENEIVDALNAEITRATDTESDLRTGLNTEINDARTAEQNLNTRIDNLDLPQVGADGSYIKLVSQSNGLVSASPETFDTTIPDSNPSNINAPTTKATKDYVDRGDSALGTALEAHTNNTNNPHAVTKAQVGLSEVVNTADTQEYKTLSSRKFTGTGAYNLYHELYDEDTYIQAEIDQIGGVVGYQRTTNQLNQYIGKYYPITITEETYVKDTYYIKDQNDEYTLAIEESYLDYPENTQFYNYIVDFNYVYKLDPNGFIQQTKNLADQNKSRLDNLENNQTGISVTGNGVGVANDLTVNGDLVVKGTTTTSDQQTIQSESTIIVTNSSNAPLVKYSGTVALKGHFEEHEVTALTYHPEYFYYIDDDIDDPTARVIVVDGHKYVLDESPTYTEGRQYYSECAEAIGLYDKDEDAVLIGEGNYYGGNFEFDFRYSVVTLTQYSYKPNTYYIKQNDQYILATGDFDPNETYYLKINQGQHLATRVDSNNLTNGNLIEWDGTSYLFKDSGKSIVILENEHNQEIAARQNADQAILNNIGTPNDSSSENTVYGYINKEINARRAADDQLENDFNLALTAVKNELDQDIADETSARQTADNTLQDNLDNETERAIIAETILQDNIDQLAGGTETSLAEEITARESGDEALGQRIDNVIEDIGTPSDQWDESGDQTVYGYINKETQRAITEEQTITQSLNNYKSSNNSRVSTIEGNVADLYSTKANKTNAVGSVDYKVKNNVKTFTRSNCSDNPVETDIVDINTLKSDMELNNVTNDRQIKGLSSGTTVDHIVLFGSDGYTVKDSGWTLDDTGKIDTISINGTDIPAVNKNVDLPAYPTQFLITANATDGLFNITGSGNYNSVTYSFAPYETKQLTTSFYTEAVNPTLTDRLNYDGYLYATKLYSNGSETITESNISTITTSQIDNLFTQPYIANGDNEQF